MSKIIEILPTFKYAINIKDDYSNPEKLNNFIPTYTNVNLLANYLAAIDKDSNKSFLLSGAYGTGKSFMISILIAFLNGKIDLKSIEPLLKKIEEFSEYTDFIKAFINNKKYVIVFPQDIFPDFYQAMMLGVSEAISRYKMNTIMNSSYQSILDRIERWEKEHKSFANALNKSLKSRNTKLSEFKSKIADFDKKSYKLFEDIYPEIMGGEKFIPLGALNSLTDLMQEFESLVKDKGYDGVIYVFDEFGRYLEENINSIDVKKVQDAAEYCNSGSDSALFLITHKDIFQYSRKLNKIDSRNEWEKVSGRFNKTHLTYEETNTLKLIKTVLHKQPSFDKLLKKNTSLINNQIELLEYIGANQPEAVKDLYPLSYVTALMLPRLSQQLAQNERSLFAFLCGDEQGSLQKIFSNSCDKFELVTPDKLYDYFEHNFKFLGINSKEYNIYVNAKNILDSIDDKKVVAKKFVKNLAIFYIVNEFKNLPPSQYYLKLAMGTDVKDFEKACDFLFKKELIAYRKHYDLYVLAQDIDFNIDLEVQKYTSSLDEVNYEEILNKYLPLGYEYPVAYNAENKITRYFKKCYLDISDVSKIETYLKDTVQDGIIAYVLNYKKDSSTKLTDISKTYTNVIFLEPKYQLDIWGELRELEALDRLEATKEIFAKSETAKNELNQYRIELCEYLENKIKVAFSIGDDLRIVSNGSILRKIKTSKDYDNRLKELLEIKYPKYHTGMINYELINKTNLTAPVKKCRREILYAIRNKALDDNYFSKTGAENSIARIVLKNTNIFNTELQQLDFLNSRFSTLYNCIIEHVKSSKDTFSAIYSQFVSNSSQYGYRRGIFTFILSLVIEQNLGFIYISRNGEEVSITPEVYDDIEENPENYTLNYIYFSSKEQQALLKLRKCALLAPYINSSLAEENLSLSIFEAFKAYVFSLPKLAFSDNSVHNTRKLIEGISLNNSKDFFFKKLPKVYKSDNFSEITDQFLNDIEALDNTTLELHNKITNIISEVFKIKDSGIQEGLKEYCQREKSLEQPQLLDLINRSSFNTDSEFVLELSRIVKGFDYYSWRTSEDIADFELKLKNIFDSRDNNNLVSTGDTIVISATGEMLKKKLRADIKNMGTSLSRNEIKNIFETLITEL